MATVTTKTTTVVASMMAETAVLQPTKTKKSARLTAKTARAWTQNRKGNAMASADLPHTRVMVTVTMKITLAAANMTAVIAAPVKNAH